MMNEITVSIARQVGPTAVMPNTRMNHKPAVREQAKRTFNFSCELLILIRVSKIVLDKRSAVQCYLNHFVLQLSGTKRHRSDSYAYHQMEKLLRQHFDYLVHPE